MADVEVAHLPEVSDSFLDWSSQSDNIRRTADVALATSGVTAAAVAYTRVALEMPGRPEARLTPLFASPFLPARKISRSAPPEAP